MLIKRDTILEVTDEDINSIEYAKLSEENVWRVGLIKEITGVKFGQLNIDGFTIEECEEMLQFACIS